MNDTSVTNPFKVLVSRTGDMIWQHDNQVIVVVAKHSVCVYGTRIIKPEEISQGDKYQVFLGLTNGGTIDYTFDTVKAAQDCLDQIINWRAEH